MTMSEPPPPEAAPRNEGVESPVEAFSPDSNVEPPYEAPTEPSPSPPSQGFGEWLWRGRALREARASLQQTSAKQRLRLQRARTAAEWADRALDPVDPLRNGSAIPLTFSLYREAVYWALLAQEEELEASSLKDAFAISDEELLLGAVNRPEDLTTIQEILCRRSFITTAGVALPQLEVEARMVSQFLHVLLKQPDQGEQTIQILLFQRWAHISGLFLLMAALIIGAVLGLTHSKKKPDLAAGKPWKTSSTGLTCYPQRHQCGSATTDILFHTQEEDNPWFEIDLKAPTSFRQIDVHNRSDCCPDRAVPLVIEISDDRQKWQEIARRNETFDVWTATFNEQKARYVRARALRHTTLHLEKMAIRGL